MAAPVFFAPAGIWAAAPPAVGDRVRLAGSEGRHAATVVRVRPGETIELVDGVGLRVGGRVVEVVKPDAVEVAVVSVEREPESRPHLTVVQALVKGERGDRALEQLTEVGVDQIVPWQAERCVVRWDAKADRGRARWEEICREASKQSRRARVPDVSPCADSGSVAALLATASLALVLHEAAELPLASVDVDPDAHGRIVVVVGPEGGITDAESMRFSSHGAHQVRLGPTVLRAATAGPVAAALLMARTGRWGLAGSAT